MSDKRIEDLEHKILEEKIDNIGYKLHSNLDLIGEKIQGGFDLLRAETEAQNKVSFIQREEIIAKQDETNGRVKALEIVTSSLKYLQENKKIAALVFYAIYNMLQHLSVSNIYRIYQWIQSVI